MNIPIWRVNKFLNINSNMLLFFIISIINRRAIINAIS